MSFNWSEYLLLAQELVNQNSLSATEEACFRSAISRAYYAAFILGRNRLRDRENLPINLANTHQYVIQQFNNSPELIRQKIGKDLSRLRANRNLADYEDNLVNLSNLTKRSLKLARGIIGNLESLEDVDDPNNAS
jgi:uncharacterized protein (UPF0332 family)